jgi:exodeoxyribonuclease VII small subunit
VETDAKNRENYGELVARLEKVVGELEKGDLPLEASLDRFAEGIRLVKKGEEILAAAEKRVDQLLSDDGAEKVVPLQPQPNAAANAHFVGHQVDSSGNDESFAELRYVVSSKDVRPSLIDKVTMSRNASSHDRKPEKVE